MMQYIQPFIKTCKHVFSEYVGKEIDAKLPYFKDKSEASDWDISAVIGLTGEARGAVVISMKQELAISLTTILTGIQHESLDRYVVDATGELINIIAGNVKHELENAFRLVISLPTIVKGKEHTINWPDSQTRVICIPFTTVNNDNFVLSVALESVKNV